MTHVSNRTDRHTRWRAEMAAAMLCIGALSAVTACGVLRANGATPPAAAIRMAISEATGWTRAATTEHYLVVVNVLPSESMMTRAEVQATHPTEGELIVDGIGLPYGAFIRHVEAHIYDRATGKAITGMVPSIKLTNRTTGEVIDVPPTLMQDVIIGPLDLHFGNNVPVADDSDISVLVTVDGEGVSVDGHID